MIEVKAIRFDGALTHRCISYVLWSSRATAFGIASRRALVNWLSASAENEAVVIEGTVVWQIAVVTPDHEPPYLRTRVEGVWTDHLLALPTF